MTQFNPIQDKGDKTAPVPVFHLKLLNGQNYSLNLFDFYF